MGLPWRRIFRFARKFAPLFVPFGGLAGRIAATTSSAIAIAERTIDSGAEKHEKVRELVGDALELSEVAVGRDIFDNDKVSDAVNAVIVAEVALRNAHKALVAAIASYRPHHEGGA